MAQPLIQATRTFEGKKSIISNCSNTVCTLEEIISEKE